MKNIVVLFLILSVIVLPTMVSATTDETGGFSMNMATNEAILNRGEEVIITISLQDVTNGGEGINVFKATLDYDKNIFEEISVGSTNISENITPLNGWGAIIYNPDNQQFVTERADFIQQGNILQIKLKVKSDAAYGNTTVTLNTPLAATQTDQEVSATPKSVTLQIQQQSEPDPNSAQNNTNGINNIPSLNNSTNNSTSNVIDGKLPQTGAGDFIIIPIIILLINAIIVFIKYRKEV